VHLNDKIRNVCSWPDWIAYDQIVIACRRSNSLLIAGMALFAMGFVLLLLIHHTGIISFASIQAFRSFWSGAPGLNGKNVNITCKYSKRLTPTRLHIKFKRKLAKVRFLFLPIPGRGSCILRYSILRLHC